MHNGDNLWCLVFNIYKMHLSHQLQVEVTTSQNDFNEFLTHHQKVNSFQQIEDIFHIHVVNGDNEEYCAFREGIKDSFCIQIFKEVKLCSARCRDDTLCLNTANGNGLCAKHSISE